MLKLVESPTEQAEAVKFSYAAKMLSVSLSHFYAKADRGEFPTIRIGSARRIRNTVLQALIHGRDPWMVDAK